MKKSLFALLLGALLFSVTASFSQTSTETLKKPGNFLYWGTAADTLIADDTKSYVFLIDAPEVMSLSLALETDRVSGDVAYTAYTLKSQNNKDWIGIDTTAITADTGHYIEFSSKDTDHVYYKVQVTATAAVQKNLLYLWGNLRRKQAF